jgi:hypothetical protein
MMHRKHCLVLMGVYGCAALLPAQCPEYKAPVVLGYVESAALTEISGLAASRSQPGVLWAHNDSGDSARVFAMTEQGEHLGEFALSGAAAADWEDMTLGPGPDPDLDYLYLGDIGDNANARANIKIYRVAEPQLDLAGPPVVQTLTGVETITLTYPAPGPCNAETLMIDPVTGDLYIVTKEAGQFRLMRKAAPHTNGQTATLELAATGAGLSIATGGDIAPDGGRVLVRGYGSALLWTRAPGQSLALAMTAEPCVAPLATEPQGEAIAFAFNGLGYMTLSERVNQPVYYFKEHIVTGVASDWMLYR